MEVCPIRARNVGESALRHARRFEATSLLETSKKSVKEVDWTDLKVGKLLGQGSFSAVYQVLLQDQHYALKILKKTALQSPSFESGAIDLVIEARMLRKLDHPNIINIHGVKAGCLSKSFSESGYFVVLEKLHGTLEEKLKEWEKIAKNPMSRLVRGAETDVPSLLVRLESVALGIVSAMDYLHCRNICYRDLKPQNIGFAQDGTVRLFDFGLAIELTADKHPTIRSSALKGQTGSARYMAPENATCQPYGLPCDVYSFGLVLWEICSLKICFQKLTPSRHAKQVIFGGLRPPLNSQWSRHLKSLMQACWSEFPEERPRFDAIKKAIEQECTSLRSGADEVLFTWLGSNESDNHFDRSSSPIEDSLSKSERVASRRIRHYSLQRPNVIPKDLSASEPRSSQRRFLRSRSSSPCLDNEIDPEDEHGSESKSVPLLQPRRWLPGFMMFHTKDGQQRQGRRLSKPRRVRQRSEPLLSTKRERTKGARKSRTPRSHSSTRIYEREDVSGHAEEQTSNIPRGYENSRRSSSRIYDREDDHKGEKPTLDNPSRIYDREDRYDELENSYSYFSSRDQEQQSSQSSISSREPENEGKQRSRSSSLSTRPRNYSANRKDRAA